MNYRFLTTETNLKALYIYISLFVHNLISKAIFVYNCVFRKKEKNTHETFHILKMKTHFEKEPRFKMEAHSETHVENENMFLEK